MFIWVYTLATGEFLQGGPCELPYNPTTQGVVVLARHPVPRLERYDGAGGVRPATLQESIDYDTAQETANAQGRFDSEKMTKALAIWTAGKVSVPLATAKAEIIAIYRGLP